MNVVRAHWYLLSVLSTNLWSADIDIYSQNAVLTAAALPLSSYIQGTNKNQVYIGMFRPDHNAPVWQGNLKLYQIALGQDNSTAILVDADGKPLIDMGSGLINSRARSFWTSGDDSPMATWLHRVLLLRGCATMLAAIAPTLPALASVAV
jgi:type IV pilus assembly protein PilY1